MTLTRQMTFWVLTFVVGVAALWILHEILLPFVAGMALAYLFDPLADRLERMGVNRLAATLVIIGAVVLVFVLLHPAVRADSGRPARRLRREAPRLRLEAPGAGMESSRDWLRKSSARASAITGRRPGQQSAGWITDLPQVAVVRRTGDDLDLLARGRDAGGRVLPALRLEPDGGAVDSWIPLQQRETVRELAREMDVRSPVSCADRPAVCLILGSFYAVSLTLAGLNFGLLIGLASGLITFIPYVGSMTGLVLAAGVAVAQFWPATGDPARAGHLLRRPVHRRLRAGAKAGRRERRACIRCG